MLSHDILSEKTTPKILKELKISIFVESTLWSFVRVATSFLGQKGTTFDLSIFIWSRLNLLHVPYTEGVMFAFQNNKSVFFAEKKSACVVGITYEFCFWNKIDDIVYVYIEETITQYTALQFAGDVFVTEEFSLNEACCNRRFTYDFISYKACSPNP